jgi:hypothetical protein
MAGEGGRRMRCCDEKSIDKLFVNQVWELASDEV